MDFVKNKSLRRATAFLCSVIMFALLVIPNGGLLFGTHNVYGGQEGTKVSVDGDYFYDFRDNSIISSSTDGSTELNYETLTIKPGNQNAFALNGAQHGAQFSAGNSIEIAVAGDTRLTIGDCAYSNMTELTVVSEDGKYSESKATKVGCYHNDGSAMVFNYTGGATKLIINFTATVYMPCIQVEALHKMYDFRDGSIIPTNTTGTDDVTYGSLTVKASTTTAYNYNGAQHGIAFNDGSALKIAVTGPTKVSIGDCAYSNMTSYTLTSEDSSYSETKATKAGCYHNDGSAVEFKYMGGPTVLTLAFTNTAYVPCVILDAITEDIPDDNGVAKDSVYMYNFANGSVVESIYDAANKLNGSITSKDGFLTITSAGTLYMHDTQHGLALLNGDKFEIKVAGDSTITFNLCQYGADTDATIQAKTAKGEFDVSSQLLQGTADDGLSQVSFRYTGVATTLTFTVKTVVDKAEMYLHGINVANEPAATETPELVGNGKADVWDFGAEVLDTNKYNNKLTADIINSWYPETVAAGSEGSTIGAFQTDEFFFNPAGKDNNRIRTNNTAITRYDKKDPIVIAGQTLTGYLYSNNTTPVVYAGIKLYKNDTLTLYTGSNGGASTIYCESPSGKIQVGQSDADGKELKFYASEYGIYKIYSTNEKLVIYRAVREHTQPVMVSGDVDITAAELIAGIDYTIDFTCVQTGEKQSVSVNDGKYEVYLNETYDYKVALGNANGYVIKSTTSFNLPAGNGNKTLGVDIEAVDIVTITGSITGLSADALNNISLEFVNTDMIYVPTYTLSGDQITMKLERNVEYSIVANGINDYRLSGITTISKSTDGTQNIDFTLKPVYPVNLVLNGLPASAVENAVVTFDNISEEGYSYSFSDLSSVSLRDGQYSVTVTNIGNVPYLAKKTSDAKINGAGITKNIYFEEISSWDFTQLNSNPGIETIGDNVYYSGLNINASVMENKTYLLSLETGEIKVPVKKDQIVTLSYCYCAAFTANGESIVEASNSTAQIDTRQYTASEDGFFTIAGTSGTVDGKTINQTYFTSIVVADPVEYASKVTVGTDKQFTTINAALDYVASMPRPNNERVEIMVDPGNYEEMLVVSIPNVSIKNAAGKDASIQLTNKGVDIADNVVRITSYYGHGYSYYSMGTDCKYDADLLAANLENEYLTKVNPGSGTTDGSYWNATIVVTGSGFEADGIVFENSFNQYISAKEAADKVVMWETGSKGERPTTAGDTSVQKKNFVERAAAIAITGDKSVFTGCKFIGRQDTLYGGQNISSVYQHCDILGGTDYIFGGMKAVFYQCNLVMNTNDDSNIDVSYITAAQQASGRGYLMYNCNVTSTTPGVDTINAYRSKPGYFGRPWAANTSEVVYFMTKVETTDYPGVEGSSLIANVGWNNSLGGESSKMYEYGTKELSGVDASASRLAWATTLTTPYIDNGDTKINIAAFLGDWTTELQARGLVLDLNADYSEVDALIAQANALKAADYVDFSGVTKAIANVVKDVEIANQAQVDGYAAAIKNAIDALVIKEVVKPTPKPEEDKTGAEKPEEDKPGETPAPAGPTTGDTTNVILYVALLAMSVMTLGVAVATKKRKTDK